MALSIITNPPTELTLSSHWGELVERSGKNMLGMGLSIPLFTLTNWDATTTKPEIALGSIIEVGGSFYQAGTLTALTDEAGLIDGTVHIKLVPAGDGLSVVPTLTNDAIPAWDATKAGWYDGVDKFLPYEMTKASAVYTVKSEYQDQNKYVKYGIKTNGLSIINTLNVDTISENTTASGVTIDSVLIKDNSVTATTVTSTTNTVNTSLNMVGEIFPRTANTEGTWVIATGLTVTIPRGVYIVRHGGTGTDYTAIEMYITSLGSWQGISEGGTSLNDASAGICIFSDGTNFRAAKRGATQPSVTAYWRRF